MRIIYLSLLLLGAVSAFQVTKVFPKNVKVKQGGTFKVVCTTDYWYEVSVRKSCKITLKSHPIN